MLVSHESGGGLNFTKFPGGGVEYGEGLADALLREFHEETGLKIIGHQLHHINENLIASAFNPEEQLIAVYYSVQTSGTIDKYAFEEEKWGKPYFVKLEWIPLSDVKPELFRWPADKQAVEKLLNLQRSR